MGRADRSWGLARHADRGLELKACLIGEPGGRGTDGLARIGPAYSGDWLGGTRIGAGRPADVAFGLEIGVVGRHATRIGAGGLHNGGACIGAGPDGWNLGIAGARHGK